MPDAVEPQARPIPYSYLPQQFDDAARAAILSRIDDIARRGDFTLGREVGAIEAAFAARCAVHDAVGVANGTDALELCLEALGVGGEVVVPPFSFYATVAAVARRGCRPVFADVGPDCLIDPAAIEAAITPRTEAILPVHWGGHPCDMAAIAAIAARHGLAVIEDAAQAIGASWLGRPCGAWGAAAGLSLHPLKSVNVWGDGGMVVSRRPDIAAKVRLLRNHGMTDRDTCAAWGRNSRLDTIQAAVALHELERLDERLARRSGRAASLGICLIGVDGVVPPMPDLRGTRTWYLYAVRARRRDELRRFLAEHNIETKVHYPLPLHLQPAAAPLGHRRGDFPMAEAIADETLSLPVHEYVPLADIDRMANLIRRFYGAVPL